MSQENQEHQLLHYVLINDRGFERRQDCMHLHSSSTALPFFLPPLLLTLTGVWLVFLCMPLLFLFPLLSKIFMRFCFPPCLLIELISDPSDLFLIQLWVGGPDNAAV